MKRPVIRSSQSKSIALIGAGAIGSFQCELLARMPGVSQLTIVDRDNYALTNLPTQSIQPEDVGQPKALVQAKRIRRINPSITVRAVHSAVEDVPLGWLRADVLLACLDSKRARMVVNEAAWRLNVPWIDSGVGEGGLARVGVFRPGPNVACLECAFDHRDYAAEQHYPCQATAAPPASHSPAHLASLAAALQAAECAKLLQGQHDRVAAGRQILLNIMFHQLTDTHCARNLRCRFDHEILAIKKLARGPRHLSVAGALHLGSRGSTSASETALHVQGKRFLRKLGCACGFARAVFRLQGRLRANDHICPRCGGALRPLGFASLEHLTREAVPARELAMPLASLGFKPGDVFTLTRDGKALHFELATEAPPRGHAPCPGGG